MFLVLVFFMDSFDNLGQWFSNYGTRTTGGIWAPCIGTWEISIMIFKIK